ncbi:hypothetical protein N9490_04445, partial [Planktomarina temperata]|nr:hypothetical protein [Planktomarina temperata]
DADFLKVTGADADFDVADAGVVVLNFDVSTAAADMSVAEMNTAFFGATPASAGADGEKVIVAVTADADAAGDVFIFAMEDDGTDFDGITLLGTLSSTVLEDLTATNFVGYA